MSCHRPGNTQAVTVLAVCQLKCCSPSGPVTCIAFDCKEGEGFADECSVLSCCQHTMACNQHTPRKG